MKTPITSGHWTTIDEKDWDLPERISFTQRPKISCSKMAGGALLRYNQIPYPLNEWPTNWKIITWQRFSQGVRVLSPTSGMPAWQSGSGGRAPRAFGFEGQWIYMQETQRAVGNRDSTLGGRMQGFRCTRAQGRAVTPQEPRPGLPSGLGGSPGRVGFCCDSLWGQGCWCCMCSDLMEKSKALQTSKS